MREAPDPIRNLATQSGLGNSNIIEALAIAICSRKSSFKTIVESHNILQRLLVTEEFWKFSFQTIIRHINHNQIRIPAQISRNRP
ncbi:hypothetical protein AAC387_Pa02g3287 [Persea americana]